MAEELNPMQGLAEFLRSRAEIDGSDGCFAEADTLLRWAAEVEAALSAPLALPPEPGQPNTSLVDSSSRSGSTLGAGALSLPCVVQGDAIDAARPVSYPDFQQKRGRDADILDEAQAAYAGWLLDDDYDAVGFLRAVFAQIEQRRAMTEAPPPNPAGEAP